MTFRALPNRREQMSSQDVMYAAQVPCPSLGGKQVSRGVSKGKHPVSSVPRESVGKRHPDR